MLITQLTIFDCRCFFIEHSNKRQKRNILAGILNQIKSNQRKERQNVILESENLNKKKVQLVLSNKGNSLFFLTCFPRIVGINYQF